MSQYGHYFSIIFPVNEPAFVPHLHDRYIVLTL